MVKGLCKQLLPRPRCMTDPLLFSCVVMLSEGGSAMGYYRSCVEGLEQGWGGKGGSPGGWQGASSKGVIGRTPLPRARCMADQRA